MKSEGIRLLGTLVYADEIKLLEHHYYKLELDVVNFSLTLSLIKSVQELSVSKAIYAGMRRILYKAVNGYKILALGEYLFFSRIGRPRLNSKETLCIVDSLNLGLGAML